VFTNRQHASFLMEQIESANDNQSRFKWKSVKASLPQILATLSGESEDKVVWHV
jgi:hypothetical protein